MKSITLAQLQSQKHQVLAILMVSILLDFVGVGIVLPLLPFYAQSFQASSLDIGLLLGIHPLLSVIAPPLWGSVSDRVGRRPALILNLLGTTLSYSLLATSHSLGMLFGSRVLAGVSSASIVIAQAYVTDLTTTKNRAKAFSLLETAVGIGFILGPVIGSVLLGNNPDQPNFQVPGLVAAIASFFTLIVTLLALPRIQYRPKRINRTSIVRRVDKPLARPFQTPSILRSILQAFQEVRQIFQRPLLAPIMVWVFITMFVSVGMQVIFPLWSSQRFGWGAQHYGYLIVVFSVLTAIVQIGLTGHLVRRFGERNLALFSISSAALGLFLIALSTSVLQFAGAVLFSIFAQATCTPALTSLVSQLAGAKQQGKTLGLMQSTTALAGFMGAIWVGFAFDSLGTNWPLWINGCLLIISVTWGWYQVSTTQLAAVMAQRRQQKLNYLFNILDHDGNGVIELQDFQRASQQLAVLNGWVEDSSEDVMLQHSFLEFGRTLQRLADYDNNGNIDQKEWQQLFKSNVDNDFQNKFIKLIDTNQDEYISTDELKHFYQIYGITIENIEDVFHILDFDQEGNLSKAKFLERLTQFIYSDDIQASGTWLFGVYLPKQL